MAPRMRMYPNHTDEELENLGLTIDPNSNCPHLDSPSFHICRSLLVSLSDQQDETSRRDLFQENKACTTCGDEEDTWVCLVCAFSGCSRFQSRHCLAHVNDESNSHSSSVVAICLDNLSVWCFACEDYVTHSKVEPVFRELHRGMFGSLPSEPHSSYLILQR